MPNGAKELNLPYNPIKNRLFFENSIAPLLLRHIMLFCSIRDHSIITSAKRWVGGVAKYCCLQTRWAGGDGKMLTSTKKIRNKNIRGKNLKWFIFFWKNQSESVYSMFVVFSIKSSLVWFWPYLLTCKKCTRVSGY